MYLEPVLRRQRAAPQYHERVALVIADLESRHVSKEIIERVIRLNDRLIEGNRLRGWNYKKFFEPGLNIDATKKGWVIARHGVDFWKSIPKSEIFKRGRREYITGLTYMRNRTS